jgi:triacylglycerol esterase/lipase EstA (alpha/beta hydrolase family)
MIDVNNTPKTRSNDKDWTIMLIHGLWMTPANWDNLKERFQWLGYKSNCTSLARSRGEY